jgi:hypothetical protein
MVWTKRAARQCEYTDSLIHMFRSCVNLSPILTTSRPSDPGGLVCFLALEYTLFQLTKIVSLFL